MDVDFFKLQETFFNSDSSKRFYSPSKIHWGENSFKLALTALRGKKAIVFYDQSFCGSSFLDDLIQTVNFSSTFHKISRPPSPEAIQQTSLSEADLFQVVIALGGGSTIDFAKGYIAHRAWRNIDGVGMKDRRGISPTSTGRPVFVVIPTTAGTGAECSRYYVTYSSDDNKKVHGKSWFLVADWVFLDPLLGVGAPFRLKVESAFDAFIHLTESHLCMREATWVNSALCLASLGELRRGLELVQENSQSKEGMLSLMTASTVGGLAISNVRTGHIHEMAGAFLELFALNHPQSLWVFFKFGLRAVFREPAGKLKLDQVSRAFGMKHWAAVEAFWWNLFEKSGSNSVIREVLSAAPTERYEVGRRAVIERAISDEVWIHKESPVRLTEADLSEIYDKSVSEFLRIGMLNV